jgi:methylmalonyl-CoA/ethylmalonyl-CoA epimerase
MSIEILEPGPQKSAWRDVLEAKCPGFHHMAIKTRNLTKQRAILSSAVMSSYGLGALMGAGDATPVSTQYLGALVELLEFDDDMEPPVTARG